MEKYTFRADIEIVGVNPFVKIPQNVLEEIFSQAEKEKGAIPVAGTVNGEPYKQTLIKYKGLWRLYVNTKMLKASPKRIGENIELTVWFDAESRKIDPHPKFLEALENNREAKTAFEGLPPSRKHEIIRYIASLKSEESVVRNIKRAIDFLCGKGRFVGRDKP
jgi:hypothetical protein